MQGALKFLEKYSFPLDEVNPDLVYERGGQGAPLLSFAIPTYRRKDLLNECLRSIVKQRAKYPIEIVVADNDTDLPPGLPEAVKDTLNSMPSNISIRYFRQRINRGGYCNWDSAISLSTAPHVVLLHDDDVIHPDYLSIIIPIMNQKPENPICVDLQPLRCLEVNVGDVLSDFYELAIPKKPSVAALSTYDYFSKFAGPLVGTVFPRTIFEKVGLFPIDGIIIEDYYFMARVSTVATINIIHLPLYGWRIADNDSLRPAIYLSLISYQHKLRDEILLFCKKHGIFHRFANLCLTEKDILYHNSKFLSGSAMHIDRKEVRKKLKLRFLPYFVARVCMFFPYVGRCLAKKILRH